MEKKKKADKKVCAKPVNTSEVKMSHVGSNVVQFSGWPTHFVESFSTEQILSAVVQSKTRYLYIRE